ncbi:MAG TPA: tetratricopeptide repeat protein, partial [Pirellulaceae bacterium]|nr:tetratricopeptide repeat protein [Pirellulaceae bacterium]
ALVVQMQLQARQHERCDKWLDQLAQAEPASLRPAALRAQVAVARDPSADVESLVEAKALEVAAAASNPTDQKKLLAGIGDLYASLKQYAPAERWYRKLVALAPDQYPLLVGTLAKQGRLADAIAICEQAAKTETTSRPILVMVAALTDGTPGEQDYKQAEPLLAAALARFDKEAGLLYSATLVRISQGRYDAAAELYRQILEINPKFVPALNNLAMLLAERPAERGEAITLIDRAIEIAGKDAGLLDTKGAILTYSSRSAEAVPLLVAATRGAAADPRHHFHLAIAYRDQGKLEEAKVQLKTALERQLTQQVLMPTDQRLLAELRSALAL